MIRETREVVSLSAKEVEDAIKSYVREKGFKVPSYAHVVGLDLGSAKIAVSVTISQSSEGVKT